MIKTHVQYVWKNKNNHVYFVKMDISFVITVSTPNHFSNQHAQYADKH